VSPLIIICDILHLWFELCAFCSIVWGNYSLSTTYVHAKSALSNDKIGFEQVMSRRQTDARKKSIVMILFGNYVYLAMLDVVISVETD